LVDLGFQTLAVFLAGCLLFVVLARLATPVGFFRLAVLAVFLVLAFVGVAAVPASWRDLDEIRARGAGFTAESARARCTEFGADLGFMSWVAARIPVRERFYMTVAPDLPGFHDSHRCIRFMLLPRLQVARLEDARYVVFWESVPEPLLEEVRRRGGVVETYRRNMRLARLP
jgi:hypothetical protein